HDLENERRSDDLHAGEVVGVRAHRDRTDAHGARVSNCLTKERVAPRAALGWKEVIRSLEISRIDLVGGDEIPNLDLLRRLERGRLEVLVGELDELSFAKFEALDDLAPRYDRAVFLANPFIAHR